MRQHDAEHAVIDRVERAVAQMRAALDAPCPASGDLWAQAPEEARHRSQPAQAAIHCCLIAMGALLEATHVLVSHSLEPPCVESERESKTLNELTRTAGRSAYRAGLILTEPALSPPPH